MLFLGEGYFYPHGKKRGASPAGRIVGRQHDVDRRVPDSHQKTVDYYYSCAAYYLVSVLELQEWRIINRSKITNKIY